MPLEKNKNVSYFCSVDIYLFNFTTIDHQYSLTVNYDEFLEHMLNCIRWNICIRNGVAIM